MKDGLKPALQLDPNNFNSMHIKGYALYILGNYGYALDLMEKSWNLRLKESIYFHKAYLQLEEAKKAAARSSKEIY